MQNAMSIQVNGITRYKSGHHHDDHYDQNHSGADSVECSVRYTSTLPI